MAGKPAIKVVSRHFLMPADIVSPGRAQLTFPAWQHCWNNHPGAQLVLIAPPGCDHGAADLMTQHQRQIVLGAHIAGHESQVGVAQAAPGDLDHHLVASQGINGKFPPLQSLAWGREKKSVSLYLVQNAASFMTAKGTGIKNPNDRSFFSLLVLFQTKCKSFCLLN
jgi:hypothetical protein